MLPEPRAGNDPTVQDDPSTPEKVTSCTKRTHNWVGKTTETMICIECGRYFSYAQAATEKHLKG